LWKMVVLWPVNTDRTVSIPELEMGLVSKITFRHWARV
jgi:hypothetical protein